MRLHVLFFSFPIIRLFYSEFKVRKWIICNLPEPRIFQVSRCYRNVEHAQYAAVSWRTVSKNHSCWANRNSSLRIRQSAPRQLSLLYWRYRCLYVKLRHLAIHFGCSPPPQLRHRWTLAWRTSISSVQPDSQIHFRYRYGRISIPIVSPASNSLQLQRQGGLGDVIRCDWDIGRRKPRRGDDAFDDVSQSTSDVGGRNDSLTTTTTTIDRDVTDRQRGPWQIVAVGNGFRRHDIQIVGHFYVSCVHLSLDSCTSYPINNWLHAARFTDITFVRRWTDAGIQSK